VKKSTIVIVAAGLLISASMGTRQTFGLFIESFSSDRGMPVTVIAFAMALHNLVWGFAQPFAGAAADRYGAAPVVVAGSLAFAAGLVLAAAAPSGVVLVIGLGLMVGIGISCTTFGVVLTAVGRAAAPEKRSMAMGLASAAGSLGQVALVPLAQAITEASGLSTALAVLALVIVAVAPLSFLLGRQDSGATPAGELDTPPLSEMLSLAIHHPGYRLLTLGFFTCGFQLAFIATYLPGYLLLCQMPVGLGATALALIGLFNMVGTWACGWLGGRFRQQYVLVWLYLIRAVTIGAFVALPKTGPVVIGFAAIMGLTWLGTVPLTSGWVAKVFGMRHLGTLFGICFFSHQVGSFLGAWSGGVVFDLTGSYTLVWGVTAVAGLLAAAVNMPIKDAPAHNSVPATARA
jgi:predicted MFS family arabinose efflux permease